MTEQLLGFGIVGCGMIADFHARAVQEMENTRLICVFDSVAGRAKALAAKYGCIACSDYDAFLACDGLDVVTIATPSGAHLDPTCAAARAGKHVICEKPLEVTLERIDEMIDVCEANGVVLAGIFPRRYNDATLAFKQAMTEGRLGQPTMADAYVKWYRTQAYYDQSAWRGTWKLDGGGALMNQSIHTIDLLLHLAGEVESVCAFATLSGHEGIEVEDTAVAILRFKSGAMGVIEGATTCYSAVGHAAEVQICGTQGSIFMQDDKFRVWEFREERPEDGDIRKRLSVGSGGGAGAADPGAIDFTWHQRCFEDAVQAIREGRTPSVDGREGRRPTELILAIYQSALAGGVPVRLPLARTPERKSFV